MNLSILNDFTNKPDLFVPTLKNIYLFTCVTELKDQNKENLESLPEDLYDEICDIFFQMGENYYLNSFHALEKLTRMKKWVISKNHYNDEGKLIRERNEFELLQKCTHLQELTIPMTINNYSGENPEINKNLFSLNAHLTALEKLSFDSYNDSIEYQGKNLLQAFPTLTKLKLHGISIPLIEFQSLFNSLGKNRVLKKLSLNPLILEQRVPFYNTLKNALKINLTLQALILKNNQNEYWESDPDGEEILANIVKECTQLKKIVLSNVENFRWDKKDNMLPRAFAENTTLKKVHLKNFHYGFPSLEIVSMIENNTQLKTLKLINNKFSVIDFNSIICATLKSRSITSLDLNYNLDKSLLNLNTQPILETLSEMIATNATLSKLSLEGIRMKHDDECLLGKMLTNNESLTFLNLANTEIGTKAVIGIAEGLKINRTLQYLDLSENDIEADGISALIEAVKINHVIKTLGLDLDIFSESEDEELKELWELSQSHGIDFKTDFRRVEI
jgi:hypothetical protein